jgi:hypothetical protein
MFMENKINGYNNTKRLTLEDFYRWYNINYCGDLEDFRDYKVTLQKAGIVKLRDNKYIFNSDDALRFDHNGSISMKNFYFWCLDDCDCMVEDNFNGTILQAKKRATELAKQFNALICIVDSETHDDVAVIDANGNDVYL